MRILQKYLILSNLFSDGEMDTRSYLKPCQNGLGFWNLGSGSWIWVLDLGSGTWIWTWTWTWTWTWIWTRTWICPGSPALAQALVHPALVMYQPVLAPPLVHHHPGYTRPSRYLR